MINIELIDIGFYLNFSEKIDRHFLVGALFPVGRKFYLFVKHSSGDGVTSNA